MFQQFLEAIPKELTIIFQILLSVLLGGFVGLDRERHDMPAGIRTYASVCMGAAIFTLIGFNLPDISSAARVIANIVAGVGFIGAGIIFRNTVGKTTGLTTASTVWVTAGIGVAVGSSLFLIAIFSTIIIYFILSMHHYKWFNKWVSNMREKHKDCADTRKDD